MKLNQTKRFINHYITEKSIDAYLYVYPHEEFQFYANWK